VSYLLECFILGISNFFNLFRLYWYLFIPVTVGILICPVLIRFLRVVFGRVVFVQKLKKICKEKNIPYQASRSSLLSIFSKHTQIDFIISLEQKETVLCFFPGITLKKNIYIQNKNCAFYTKSHALSFVRNKSEGFSGSLILVDEGLEKKIAMTVPVHDRFESVLIIHPAPLKLYSYQGNGYKVSGSGEIVDSLKIYEGTDYIKFLLRAF